MGEVLKELAQFGNAEILSQNLSEKDKLLLGGTLIEETNPISEVPNPNEFSTLPDIIKVTLE